VVGQIEAPSGAQPAQECLAIGRRECCHPRAP
jgi:hypothetical protein